jgi:D-alanine-D-alanine ligase
MIRVGVIRGGISGEYDVSLETGGHILSHLRDEKYKDIYKPVDIFIDYDGLWHMNGLPSSLEKIFHSVDIVFNALHGEYGEDGKIQQILDHWKVPYTGSHAFPSALSFNKALAKEEFAKLGINTPKHILFPAYLEDLDGPRDSYALDKAGEVMSRLPPPWIVKPLTGGSSMGIHVCKTFPDLVRAFEVGSISHSSVLVEEMIIGREATVGVIDNFRGQSLYALPPVEIHLPEYKDFFDYDTKRECDYGAICPSNFSNKDKELLENYARLIHKGMNLRHYSRSDFIIHPKKGIYAIEVNTLPGLNHNSVLPKALDSVGASMHEFINHIIHLARTK